MWQYETSIETFASPQRIWSFFSDVAGWKRWNSGIENIEIHGPFAVGTTFSMKPPGQEALKSTLIDVRENELFTDETTVDGTTVVVTHRIAPVSAGVTKIVYSTTITGPSAADFGPMVTSDFDDVLQALKRVAEEPSE